MYGFWNNYQPTAQQPKPQEQPPIPEQVKRAARLRNASHLSRDGETIYKQLFGYWIKAYWDGFEYGAWLESPDGLPSEALRLAQDAAIKLEDREI